MRPARSGITRFVLPVDTFVDKAVGPTGFTIFFYVARLPHRIRVVRRLRSVPPIRQGMGKTS